MRLGTEDVVDAPLVPFLTVNLVMLICESSVEADENLKRGRAATAVRLASARLVCLALIPMPER